MSKIIRNFFDIIKDLFAFSLIIYLLLFILEIVFPNFVSNTISLNWVLAVVLFLGFLSAFAPTEDLSENGALKAKLTDYLLVLFLSFLGAGLIYYKMTDEMSVRLTVSIVSGLLIGLIGWVILNTKDEDEKEYEEKKPVNAYIIISSQTPAKKLYLRKIYLLIILLVAIPLSFSAFFIISRQTKNPPVKKETTVKTVLPTPTPKIISIFDQSIPTFISINPKLEIRVLNGGGPKNSAADFAKVLKDTGFTKVISDNADNFNYENAVIKFREEDSSQAKLIKKLLEKNYQYSLILTVPSATTSAEITVILGNRQIEVELP